MIRILITEALSANTIEKLNEIPEFEIIEKTASMPEDLITEISNIDALVSSGAVALPAAVLAAAVNLKIMIPIGGEANHMDTAQARQKNIEIRSIKQFPPPAVGGVASAEGKNREGLEMIAILKDFFNV